MSASKRRQKVAALQQIIAQTGAGLGGDSPMGRWASNQAQLAANYAQAEAERIAIKEAEKKAKSKKWGGLGAMVGGLLMPIAAPGLGAIAAPALGSALGSAAGQAAGGGGVDFGNVLMAGGTGALAGGMGKLAGGVGQAGKAAADTTAQAAVDTAAQAAADTVTQTAADLPASVSSAFQSAGMSAPTPPPLVPAATEPVAAAVTPTTASVPTGGFFNNAMDGLFRYNLASQMMSGFTGGAPGMGMGMGSLYGYGGGGVGGVIEYDDEGRLVYKSPFAGGK